MICWRFFAGFFLFLVEHGDNDNMYKLQNSIIYILQRTFKRNAI